MALNLTPCVYPLILSPSPILVARPLRVAGGEQARHPWPVLHARPRGHQLRARRHRFTDRRSHGAMLQNPIVLVVIAAILVFFATSLFGLWNASPQWAHSGRRQILYRLLRQPLYGLTLAWSQPRASAPSSLDFSPGWRAWETHGWDSSSSYLEPGVGPAALLPGRLLRATGKAPSIGCWMIWVRRLMGWCWSAWPCTS